MKFPRVAMTSATTGGYTATASNEESATRQVENLFNNLKSEPGGGWRVNFGYNTSGVYTGSSNLGSDSGGTAFATADKGEWVKIQLPHKIQLNSFTLTPRLSTSIAGAGLSYGRSEFIKNGKIWGSLNGTSWSVVHTISGSSASTDTITNSYTVSSSTAYNYFALVVTNTNTGHANAPGTSLSEWELFGIPEYDPEAHGVDVVVKSVPNVPNADWLEVYYDAKNYTSGVVQDESLNSYVGTLNSVTLDNSAIQSFDIPDGGNISATLTSIPSADFVHSVSVWVKFEGDTLTTSYPYLYFLGASSDYSGFGLFCAGAARPNQLHVSCWKLDYPINFTFSNDTWYHVTYTYSGGGWSRSSSLTAYVDGIEYGFGDNWSTGTEGTTPTIATSNVPLRLGTVSTGGTFDGKIANFRLFNRVLTTDEIYQLYAYQKEYFGHGVLGMTLKAGRLGIGTTEPIAALDVRGGIAVQGIMTTFTSPYISAYPISSISPTVWAVAGDSTARIGGGAISYTSGISIKYLNSVPMWFWGGNDEFVDIRSIIPVGDITWTIAIAIAKKPETGMVLCNQVNDTETNSMTNHRIVYTDGSFNGDEWPPGGGGWSVRNNGDIQIPNESVVVVKKEGNGTGQLFVYLNGHTIGSSTNNETGTGTAHKIRIGRRSRYSGYTVDNGGGIHGGIAAIAAWDSAISQTDMTKYITYQSMTSKN
jgi:hypothetical protein